MSPVERTRTILRSILDSDTRLILIALADHLSEHDEAPVWPSLTRLVDLTGLGKSTIQRRLKEAALTGLVRIWEEAGRGKVYQIRWQAIPPLEVQRERGAQVPRSVVTETPVADSNRCQGDTGVRETPYRGQADTPTVVSLTTEVDHSSRPEKYVSLSPSSLPAEQLPREGEREQNPADQKQEKEQENSNALSLYQLFGPEVGGALARAGITELSDLTRLTARQCRMTKGIGESAVARIRLRLQAMNLDFAEDGRVAATGATDKGSPEVRKRRFDEDPQPARQANGG